MPRFIDVKAFTHGGTSHTTIKSVDYRQTTKRIAGGADGDKVESFQMKGMTMVSGTVTIQDPVQANILLNAASGDLVFTGTPDTGSTTLTVTIKGATFFSSDNTATHDDLHGARLSFNGFFPAGSAGNWVTVANA